MSNIITQSQYNAAKQTIRNKHIKINILNFDYMPLDTIEGNVTSGSIMIDANNDIRRTCNISLVVTDSSFEVQGGGKIFLDKLIQIYVGIDDLASGEIAWTNMGIYLINKPTYNYDAANHTLSFEGLDLMAKLTGLRNGYIGGLAGEDKTLIQTGQNIREVIIGILKENNFNKYVVSECTLANGKIQDVPYDMEFSQGTTWYDVLSKLRNILPQYQIYFDVDGVFHYEQIPSSESDPIMIDDDIWVENVLNEEVEVNFEDVKNAVEVYGVIHDTQYFSDSSVSTVSNANITLTVDQEAVEVPYTIIAFTLPSKATGNITVNVNNWGSKNLVDDYGNRVTLLNAETYYVIMYQADNTWLFMGGLQAQAYWEDNNPESPFYVEGSVGRILLPLYGGEYDNIQTDALALERAKYEIYLRCRLNDTIRLTTVPIYWADVNWKVSYFPFGEDIKNQYIVQSIRTDLSANGNQTWEMSRFYPLYPTI